MAEAALPIQFKKMYSGPINPDSVFNSLSEAEAYASGPLGASGEIIGVKTDSTTGKYSAYIINEDKTLSPVGSDTSELVASLTWQEL